MDLHEVQAPDDSTLGSLSRPLSETQMGRLQGISTSMNSCDVHRGLWRQENRNIHAHFRDGNLALKQKEGPWNEHEAARDGLKSLGTKSGAPDTLPASKLSQQKMTMSACPSPETGWQTASQNEGHRVLVDALCEESIAIPQTPCYDSDHFPKVSTSSP